MAGMSKVVADVTTSGAQGGNAGPMFTTSRWEHGQKSTRWKRRFSAGCYHRYHRYHLYLTLDIRTLPPSVLKHDVGGNVVTAALVAA